MFTSNLSGNGTHESFFSDDPDYYITDNGSGESILQQCYIFSFDANGGSGTQDPVRSKTNSANLPECTFDAPENAKFVAWNDNGTMKQPGDSVSIESGYTKTISAVWTYSHSITVDIPSDAHGSVVPDKDKAFKSDTVTMDISADEGYALDYVRVKDESTDSFLTVSNNQFSMPDSNVTITAVFKATTPYVNAKGEDMAPVIAGRIGEGATIWADKWIFVDSELTISDRVTVQGEVNLILCDGAVLNVPKGITVNAENYGNLTIWCQKNGTGTLNITAPENGNAGIGGIGSDKEIECGGGKITINGGIINTVGAGSGGGSGIGIGSYSTSARDCDIKINGGTVTATGGSDGGAGIGTLNGTIRITGGTVVATGCDHAPGIGVLGNDYYTYNCDRIYINISGGKVTAKGGYCAAGIGGMVNGGGGTITISGGDVTAIGGSRKDDNQGPYALEKENNYAGAGIGSGAAVNNYYNLQTVINIMGGKVNAKGGYEKDSDISAAPGIGIGEVRDGLRNGSGSAETTLTYTTESRDTMSVASTGYNGSVTLDQTFVDNNGVTYNGEIDDNESLGNKTLRPYDGMGVTLAGHSISLQGDIAVNFYMELTSEILSHTGVYMQFTIPDTSAEYQNQKVYVSDLTPVSLEGKSYYVFKCKVAAKDMTSAIQAQLIDGDKRSIIYTYSVQEYADYLLSHTAGNEEYTKAAPLVKAMLNYGAYAQIFFDKNTANLANSTLKDADKVLGEVNLFEPAATFDLPSGVTFEGSTLSLKSETTLSFYFTSSADLEFSCTGYTVEKVTSGKYQVARIKGIKAEQLTSSLTLTVTAGEASGSVIYSPMNYCYNVLNSGTTDDKLVNVVKALCLYAQEAEKYFK